MFGLYSHDVGETNDGDQTTAVVVVGATGDVIRYHGRASILTVTTVSQQDNVKRRTVDNSRIFLYYWSLVTGDVTMISWSRIDILPLFSVSRQSIVERQRPDDTSCCWRHTWRHTVQWPCINIEGRDCLLLKNVFNNWTTVFLFVPLVMSNMTLFVYSLLGASLYGKNKRIS